MKNKDGLQMTEERINDFATGLAEFAMDFVPGDDASAYEANDFLALFNKWFRNFIHYAETNGMFNPGEKEALLDDDNELAIYIKDAAIGAARELIMEKV
ncbi:MAG: hypothetical protein JXK95_12690 [Bacteroidales bacterium]|nr:hypothetical protein [Bacteroidales bacterium]